MIFIVQSVGINDHLIRSLTHIQYTEIEVEECHER